jgi:hypothetical protein
MAEWPVIRERKEERKQGAGAARMKRRWSESSRAFLRQWCVIMEVSLPVGIRECSGRPPECRDGMTRTYACFGAGRVPGACGGIPYRPGAGCSAGGTEADIPAPCIN